MQFSYDGLLLDCVLLENWVREAVFDPSGADFLHWHQVVDIVAICGGQLTNPSRFPPLAPVKTDREIKDAGNSLFAFRGGPGRFPMIAPNDRRRFEGTGRVRGRNGDLQAALKGQRAAERNVAAAVPVADHEIRHRLQLPRRQLLAWVYSGPKGEPEFLLNSPQPGAVTDCRHGPLCTIMSLPVVDGNSSGVYRLRFETWDRPVDLSVSTTSGSPGGGAGGRSPVSVGVVADEDAGRKRLLATPPLVSNRWRMRQEVDPETYLSTTVIDGLAVFRADVLQVQRATPDMLRSQFMHPIPFGYVRMPPSVEVDASGIGVAYRVTDHEVMTNFPAGHKYGLVRLDVNQTVQYHASFEMQWR